VFCPHEPLRFEVQAGLVFEIDIAPAIRDASLRQYLIANATSLLRLTRGKGVLLTSGARSVLELRAPIDLAAIASLVGLDRERAMTAMRETPAAVLRHASLRRKRNSGTDVSVHFASVSGIGASLAHRTFSATSTGSSHVTAYEGTSPLGRLHQLSASSGLLAGMGELGGGAVAGISVAFEHALPQKKRRKERG
jgi:hypothetical protein